MAIKMKVKSIPPDELFLGLAVGSIVFFVELGLLALSLD
jgi:hypothetical protein